jgi:hypothetical protein
MRQLRVMAFDYVNSSWEWSNRALFIFVVNGEKSLVMRIGRSLTQMQGLIALVGNLMNEPFQPDKHFRRKSPKFDAKVMFLKYAVDDLQITGNLTQLGDSGIC